jgi:WD40 repeat protein
LASCSSGEVLLWDVDNARQIGGFAGAGLMRCLAFSPDDQRLVTTGYNGQVRLWDPGTRRAVYRVQDDPNTAARRYVHDVSFLADPRGIVTASSDGFLRQWRLPD